MTQHRSVHPIPGTQLPYGLGRSSPPVPTCPQPGARHPLSKQSSRAQNSSTGVARHEQRRMVNAFPLHCKIQAAAPPPHTQEMAFRVELAASSPTRCSQASSQLGAAARGGGEGEADSRKGCCSSCTRLPAPDTHTHTRDGTPTGPGRQEVQHATGQPISSHCTHASLLCFITVFSS